MSAEPDDVLVQRAAAGEQEALALLVQRHGPSVRARLSGNISARWQSVLALDDVMQQAYTDALLGISTFVPRGEGSFAAWLTTLAKNNLLNAIRMFEADKRGGDRRRIGAARATNNDESAVELFEMLGGVSHTPSREVARVEARTAMNDALEQLPPIYRQVVRQYDLLGQPIEAVAAELGRSPGATYMLRGRAHRMLAEIMGAASKYLSVSP